MATKTKSAPSPERNFQEVANDYAKRSIESLREMIQALEHAEECDGECEECCGTGIVDTDTENGVEEKCEECKGAGKCLRGSETHTEKLKDGHTVEQHDYEEPESWHDAERARERIQEDPLSIEVRSDWHTPGDESATEATEYNILLCMGGPAARIVGELRGGQPYSAKFEYQDWFKPWTEAYTDSADDAVMLEYAQQFYFGE